uniref:Uncharacterized protein n=1 Tax=Anguilla anguilla TaxID=7936 RepID=A0A0E9S346_ANGAN
MLWCGMGKHRPLVARSLLQGLHCLGISELYNVKFRSDTGGITESKN